MKRANSLALLSILSVALIGSCEPTLPYVRLRQEVFGGSRVTPEVVVRSLKKATQTQRNEFLMKAYDFRRMEYLEPAVEAGADYTIEGTDKSPVFLLFFEHYEDERMARLADALLQEHPEALLKDLGRDFNNASALSYLLSTLEYPLFKKICDSGVDLNARGSYGATPLLILAAARQSLAGNKLEKLTYLLEHGGDPSYRNNDGSGLLHYFSWYPFNIDYSAFLDRVIALGADPKAPNSSGETPLHWAVSPSVLDENSVALADYLLSNGADPLFPDQRGETPLGLTRRLRSRIPLMETPDNAGWAAILDSMVALMK